MVEREGKVSVNKRENKFISWTERRDENSPHCPDCDKILSIFDFLSLLDGCLS